jgi:hypothetical protein
MMKRIVYLHAALLCLLSIPAAATLNLAPVPNHLANPAPFDQLVDEDFIVVYGSGLNTVKAEVTSKVYEADAGGYIYTYQISNAAVKFTWFSVVFDPVAIAAITDYGVVPGTGTTPLAWEPVMDGSSDATNVEAFFSPGLTSSDSAILWFTCTDAPGSGAGALAKLSSTGGVYAEGAALVPNPEPLTVVLLGSGWALLRRHKRRD